MAIPIKSDSSWFKSMLDAQKPKEAAPAPAAPEPYIWQPTLLPPIGPVHGYWKVNPAYHAAAAKAAAEKAKAPERPLPPAFIEPENLIRTWPVEAPVVYTIPGALMPTWDALRHLAELKQTREEWELSRTLVLTMGGIREEWEKEEKEKAEKAEKEKKEKEKSGETVEWGGWCGW